MYFFSLAYPNEEREGYGQDCAGLGGSHSRYWSYPKKWEATKGFRQDGESQPMYIFKR